jgi:hypothetical protein
MEAAAATTRDKGLGTGSKGRNIKEAPNVLSLELDEKRP